MSDLNLNVTERMVRHNQFKVTVLLDDPPERIVGQMLSEFYAYLQNFGTVYERSAPKIERSYSMERDQKLVCATFRAGLDAQGKPGEIVKCDGNTTKLFGYSTPPLYGLGEDRKDKRVLL